MADAVGRRSNHTTVIASRDDARVRDGRVAVSFTPGGGVLLVMTIIDYHYAHAAVSSQAAFHDCRAARAS